MIRISQLSLPVDHRKEAIKKKAARLLNIPEASIQTISIVRRSIDARKKNQLLYSYIVDVELSDEKKELAAIAKAKGPGIQLEKKTSYRCPSPGTEQVPGRPVIIGAGPAGLFAALLLAENGYRPLLLEQGDPVEEREKKVTRFWETGAAALDPYSNVQFGEGGAGTFSDGKLNTLVKDESGRNRRVLEIFAEAGADEEILYDSKPHIGTDVLRRVVRTIRERILTAGGEVRFRSRVTELLLTEHRLAGLSLSTGEQLSVGPVILAVGHSSRELFSELERKQAAMEPKAFAVGLRIQHPQEEINLSQYGIADPKALGPAPYKVTAKTSSGRGVYSFCMCPGGFVVNASSEPGRLAVNGMSNHDRQGKNANSALIVAVSPDDFKEPGPLGGVLFQKRLEEQAFLLGQGNIPIQLYGDFLENRSSEGFGAVTPQFCGAASFSNLRSLMPEELNLAFLEGMAQFGKKIKGFDRPDAILAGIESRTSSPLRILRNEHLESNIKGLFPCGEGAGYAGGITSAAMDGLRVAEEIIRRYAPVSQ